MNIQSLYNNNANDVIVTMIHSNIFSHDAFSTHIHTQIYTTWIDLIMTQMFFDVQVFKTFVQECRKYGINVPVIPGLMCINAYAGFKKMSKFCKTRVPKEL